MQVVIKTDVLAKIMFKRSLNGKLLSRQMGMGDSAISRIMRTKTCQAKTRQRLLDVLKVPWDVLYEVKEGKKRDGLQTQRSVPRVERELQLPVREHGASPEAGDSGQEPSHGTG